MSEGKRPGGLTALAIINFILGGLQALSILALIAFFAIFSSMELNDEMQKVKDDFDAAGITMGFMVFLCIIGAIVGLLLLLSGIGYLKQKKFLGRTLGNAYAVVSVGSSLISALMLPASGGGGFNLGTIIGLIYPVLTLILLNTTFKEDFIN